MLLSLNSISKSFKEQIVLNNISLEIEQNDAIAITGPSGSGKTTLLNIIGALEKPDSGEVFFDEKNIALLNQKELAKLRNIEIGFVFQMHYLLPQCTLLENVLMPTLANPGQSKQDEYLKRAIDLINRVGLSAETHKFPGQLSGGELQRAAFVRALINKPKIILADEPTGSLDQSTAEILGNLLLELNQEFNTALIVVTHSPSLASKMKKNFQLQNSNLVQIGNS